MRLKRKAAFGLIQISQKKTKQKQLITEHNTVQKAIYIGAVNNPVLFYFIFIFYPVIHP